MKVERKDTGFLHEVLIGVNEEDLAMVFDEELIIISAQSKDLNNLPLLHGSYLINMKLKPY